MRVTPEHFDALKAAISERDTPAMRQRYIDGTFPRADLVHDLDKRYRWDLLWLVCPRLPDGIIGNYNDDHIDTALRKIVAPLKGTP